MLEYIIQLDQFLALEASKLQNQYLDILMIFFTRLWDLGLLWIWLAIVCILIGKFRYYWTQFLYWLSLNLLLWEGILKHLFHRLRPFQELQDIVLKIPEPITSSFPSGHSSASICFALLFAFFFWQKSRYSVIMIWIVAFMIIFSRWYLQVHYPSDILAGIIVWVTSATIAIHFPLRYSLISK